MIWCYIPKSTKIHPSTVIGNNGFSFTRDEKGNRKIIKSTFGIVIGENIYIGALCNIDSGIIRDTKIGDGTIIDSRVHISHDCRIGEKCEIDTGSTILGEATVGNNTRICTGAIVHQGITVGNNCVVGANAYLRDDLPDGKVAYGTPAKVIDNSNYDKVRKKY